MFRIAPFAVEQWMDEYETTPRVLNVAETCAASVSIDDLVGMCSDPKAPGPINTSLKLTYGPIPGSHATRERIAAQCSLEDTRLGAEDIVVTQGAIGANFLVLQPLGPEDHVICVYPTYQQLYEVPRSIGAEVTLWKLRKDNFVPNVNELVNLIRENTKMVIINNPNNPTGATIHNNVLERIAQVAKEKRHYPLLRRATTLGYKKTITTGSMSQGYALAGIRVGWIASKDKSIMAAIMAARDYTTISVSQIDDQIARYALSPAVLPSLVDHNLALTRTTSKLVKEFIERYNNICSWVEHTAGTTAFVRSAKMASP
ncbi:hypothetical protein F53441_14328 [Fusarium austroafricanum]|uniref:Aminotransferase class I/classII large domain-containing protein n=1 Tax=Fusarium austroafricanum TaxID=2364996 RepID=A0A8H4JH42_9HYPO|nr:hypothetical protein F53441_14328 [Fusarium austroafricanum]